MGVPDTDSDLTDVVDTVPDTDSAMLDTVPDTVSDTAMVDTVARDPLMLTTDVDTVMEVTDTAVDTDTDTESKHFPLQTNQRNHSIQNYAILITAKASEHNFKQKYVSTYIDRDNLKILERILIENFQMEVEIPNLSRAMQTKSVVFVQICFGL